MRTRLAALGLGAALLVAQAAWAQPPPMPSDPCAPPVALAAAPALALGHTLGQHLALEPQCAHDPDFLLRLGTQLNLKARYPEALLRLEAALMLRPEHAPTLLEFALALAGVGEQPSARQVLQHLHQSGALDAQHQQQVQQLLQRSLWAAAPQPAPARLHIGLGLAISYETGLNPLPRSQAIELTLPSGPIWLELAQGPALAGLAHHAELDLHGRLRPGWYHSAHIGLRSVPGSASGPAAPGQPLQAQRLHWGLALTRVVPGLQQPQQIELSLRGIEQGGRSVYRQSGILWQHTLAPAAASGAAQSCAPRLGLEAQLQRYPQLPRLDGRYLGVWWRSGCAWLGLRLQARLGFDQPEHPARPGGRQYQARLRLTWPQSAHLPEPAPGWLLVADLGLMRDAQGYSPLLAQGQPRWQLSQNLRLEHRWPVGWPAPSWQAHAWIESQRQRSNLALFNLRTQHSLGLGARRMWQ